MIDIIHLTKTYNALPALQDLTLHIEEGECLVLLGPSGCGKSTLLKLINRLIEPDHGSISVKGVDIKQYQPEALRRKIGYCIQGVGLFPHMSVYDNIAVVPRLLQWTPQQIDDRIKLLLTLTGLPLAYLDKKPQELSGGEAQRVGVCRALAADPTILLMDEPFGAVDPMTREQIQLAFLEIQNKLKKTVVFVTHDIEEAIILGDRIAIMEEGRIITLAAPGHLLKGSNPQFVKEFLGIDYPLRLLRRYTVEDLPTVTIFDNKDNELSILNENSTVKEMLAEIMKSHQQSIYIKRNDQTVVKVTYQDIIELFRQVLNNESSI